VRADRVALFGHSRGGGAASYYLLEVRDVRAAILNSTGYPDDLAERASQIETPILMLHGFHNDPADGGSAISNVEKARNFEAALRRAGKTVEVMYYKVGAHNSIFTSPAQYHDEVQRMLKFLRSYLGK